jgi:hypothetical protein
MNRARVVLLVWMAMVAAACAQDPLSPSRVDHVRVLGLKAAPPRPAPGDTLSLELLWADPAPSCSREAPCGPGRECRDGRCERTAATEVLWIVLPLAAWEPADLASIDMDELTCVMDRCPEPIPCAEDGECPGVGRCDDGFCVPCLAFGPALFCCGTRGLDRIEVEVPADQELPDPDCSGESAINTSLVYQVHAQVCAGGRIDLCPDPEALVFGCTGEGAESATATSRVSIVSDPAQANVAPVVLEPTFDLEAWGDGVARDVRGCVDDGCADRVCDTGLDCVGGQVCAGSRCREEIALRMGDGAIETYLDPCDEPSPCETDSDCRTSRVCRDGLCRRIESPFAGYFATAGKIESARDVLDDDGDGRPDRGLVYTRWLPPALDECSADGDPCSFGRCDPAAGRCTGDVTFWIVVRDGRGGQDWIERTLHIVP